jgi:Zn-dependent protease with chaperone function
MINLKYFISRFCLFPFLLFPIVSSFGQTFPLKSQGQLPKSFYIPTTKKLSHIKTSSRIKKMFYENSYYFIEDILSNGKVLFGDSLSLYINKVGNNLLERSGRKELKDKLQFFTIKNSTPNAFATHQGIICINTGLLAHIENEAQLAMVMAHEISHYIKNHSIEGYIHNRKEQKSYKKDRKEHDDYVTSINEYSISHELEADSLGFYLFSQAGYSTKLSLGVFDVLETSDLPFDDQVFELKFLEDEYYTVPNSLFDNLEDLLKTRKRKKKKKAVKSFETHPELDERRGRLTEIIDKNNVDNTINSFFGFEQLKAIRNIARIENLYIDLINGKYSKVVYEGSMLLESNKNNTDYHQFINSCIGRALYSISKLRLKDVDSEKSYLKSNKFKSDKKKSSRYKGELRKVYALLYKRFELEEILLLSLKHLENNTFEGSALYCNDLWKDYFEIIGRNPKDLILSLNELDSIKKEIALTTKEQEFESKLKRIEYNNHIKKIRLKNKYYGSTILNQIVHDSSYKSKLDSLFTIRKEPRIYEIDSISVVKKSDLSNSKILVMQPYVGVLFDDFRYRSKSLKEQRKINQIFSKVMTGEDKIIYLNRYEWTENSIEEYNTQILINEWLIERSKATSMHRIPINHHEVSNYIRRNDIDNILISGFLEVETINLGDNPTTLIALGAVSYFFFPLTLQYSLKRKVKNHFFSYSIETNEWRVTNKYSRKLKNTLSDYEKKIYLGDMYNQILSNK